MKQGFLPMGLHARPAGLRAAIADLFEKPRHREGSCSALGCVEMRSTAFSYPHPPLQVPRVHNYIPLLAGYPSSHDCQALEKGIFYLSGDGVGRRDAASAAAADTMAGAVGAGGLGGMAIRYGYLRFNTMLMVAVIAILLAVVCLVQFSGERYVRNLRSR
jgi:hypothetical protein